MRGQRHAPAALYTRERPGTHCTGSCVGPKAGLDVCEKPHPHRDFFLINFNPIYRLLQVPSIDLLVKQSTNSPCPSPQRTPLPLHCVIHRVLPQPTTFTVSHTFPSHGHIHSLILRQECLYPKYSPVHPSSSHSRLTPFDSTTPLSSSQAALLSPPVFQSSISLFS